MAVSLGSAVLTIGGDSTGLHQALRNAEQGTRAAMASIASASRYTGVALSALGVGISTALGMATREAISFESAFAGVRKTMDASEEEFAAINKALREMALTIPVSADELARIAEMGGQLGVPKEAIIAFTRVVADLSVATDMTGESAATMLAQFMNIMQIPWSQFDNLGAVIVDLGNNGASTEGQIAEFGNRLAGAGKIAGLSAPEIYGFGSALASLGIDAEAGGTAFSKVFIMLRSAVDTGGQTLKDFAAVAGMTSEQFVAAYKEKPAQAILSFVEGLGKIEKAGGSLFVTLDALDIKEIRLRDALLRTSGAGQLVAQNITLANQAFKENTALTDEATKRYATTASQIQILKNTLRELAMQVGEILLPPLRELAERARVILTQIIGWVQANPQLTEQLVKWAAVIGVVASALGPLLIALPGVAIAIGAMGSALAALATPVGIAISLLVGGLVVAFMYLREHMEQAKAWVISNWDRIVLAFNTAKEIILTAMRILGQAMRAAWIVIAAIFTGVVNGISTDMQRLGDTTGKYADDWLGTLQMMLDWVNRNLPTIEAWVRWLADSLQSHWAGMVSGVTEFYNRIVQPMMMLAKLFYYVANIVVTEATRILTVINQLAGVLGFAGGGGPAIPPVPPGGPQIPGMARGGTSRGGLTWVGEQGPELVNLPRGAQVHSAKDSAQMAGGGATINQTFNVTGITDPEVFVQYVSRRIEQATQNTLAKRGLRLSRA